MRTHLLAAATLMAASFTAAAQLKDRFEVVSARTSLPSPIENGSASAEKRANPELLVSERRYREAASVYRAQIRHYHDLNDMTHLDQACQGLYRVLFLSGTLDADPDAFELCRNEALDKLFARADREPMFLTNPIFQTPISWVNTADPGKVYTVQVRFDIDESGRAENFDFVQREGYYLSYPVLSALKQSKYLPAVKDGKPVRSSGNLIEVTFCLERGKRCEESTDD
ncbi:energy transducer TonB [Arenimonas sp. GDDSR-1]|uniref:energy transducer TonB n=1 Tax=Arenimonas sp. GDDSR-1 TaxID=2950125 RepID=UPI00263A09AE|nr:energy transducer TonB [Arenimonas sp. GDDSR-1]